MADDPPFQALYRRHRPRRFGEVRGQDHVTKPLRNAVAAERVGHAYLFSGPRGTGKTSTARILAAALNCAHPAEGEPDTTCDSCVAIQTGASLDVLELDAASNNGVDAMRDLVARAALGSPGRWKVYIVDEVHMLTTGASNALLKTLEEPPAHVVFVLATTDDQKVIPTIKSRTQHYHFRLLAPEILSSLVADLNEQDGLGLDPATLDRVVRRGSGSARDALSALDQAAAAGTAEDESDAVPEIVEALVARDPGAALVAVAKAAGRGRDPQRLALEVVEHLRAGFLLVMAPDVSDVPAQQRPAIEDQARRLGTPASVRAMEVLGETLVAMRESLDVRVTFELALVRLCAAAADTSPAAILERLEILERRMTAGGASGVGGSFAPGGSAAMGGAFTPGGGSAGGATPSGPPAMRPDAPTASDQPAVRRPDPPTASDQPAVRRPDRPAERADPAAGGPAPSSASAGPVPGAGAVRRPGGERIAERPPEVSAPPPPAPPRAPNSPGPKRTLGAVRQQNQQIQQAPPSAPAVLDRDELTKAWGDHVFGALSTRARAAFRDGRWRSVDGRTAVFAFGESTPQAAVEERAGEVEAALSAHFGGAVQVRVEPEKGAARPQVDEPVSSEEFATLEDAPDAPDSAAARLLEAFPGTEEIIG